jgi:hypothetical protein
MLARKSGRETTRREPSVFVSPNSSGRRVLESMGDHETPNAPRCGTNRAGDAAIGDMMGRWATW